MKTKSKIKIIPKKDYATFVDIVANAYPGMKIITQEDKKKTIAQLKKSSSYPTVNYYGLYRENMLTGVMALYDFTINLFTNMVKTGGIGLVAVDLLHKKEKICKEMVYFFLEYFKKKGASLTALYPFRPDFYRKMGFGIGTKITQYTIKPKDLMCWGAKKHIHHMGLKDREKLESCYNRFVKNRHGMLSARPNKWLQVLNAPGVRTVGYKKADKILGYIIFTFNKAQDNNWIKNDIIIREFIYENRDAFNELISFLHTQYDQINHIVFTTHDEYFHYSLHDPRDGTDNILVPLAHQTNTQGIGIMYRVISTKLLFKILKNHNFNDQTCKIKINIKDSFFKPNDLSIILHIINGKIKGSVSKKYDVEIWLDVADFSSLIMGAVDFQSLYKYGLADISSTRFINLANSLFSVAQKPMSTTQF
ncbi:MAG: GNAT family N-acetyltransferase [bacterium]